MQQLEQPVNTKEVVVGKARYQIARMNAEVGSWLLFKLMDSLRKIAMDLAGQDLPAAEEIPQVDKEAAASGLIQSMLMTMDRGMFQEVQREALKVCGQFAMVGEKEVILPVLMANGSFAIPELKNDISSVVTLTSSSLYFNLSPFFVEDGLQQMFKLS